MLKKFFKTLAVILVIPIAFICYVIYADYMADKAASTFCSTIRVGLSSEDLLASAAQSGCRMWNIKNEDGYRFLFQGAPHYAAACYVKMLNDKVISAEFTVEDD